MEELDEEQEYYDKIGLDINRLNCLNEMKKVLEGKKDGANEMELDKLWRVYYNIGLIYYKRG